MYRRSEACHPDDLSKWLHQLYKSTHGKPAGLLECLFVKALSLYHALGGGDAPLGYMAPGRRSVIMLLQMNALAQFWHIDPITLLLTRNTYGTIVEHAKAKYFYGLAPHGVPNYATEVKRMDAHDEQQPSRTTTIPWDTLESHSPPKPPNPARDVFSSLNAHRGPQVRLPPRHLRVAFLDTSVNTKEDEPDGQVDWELERINIFLDGIQRNSNNTEEDEEDPWAAAAAAVLRTLQQDDREQWFYEDLIKFLEYMHSKGAYSRTPFWHRMRRSNELSDAIANIVVIALPRTHSPLLSVAPFVALSFALWRSFSPSFPPLYHTPTYLHPAGSPLHLSRGT